MGVNKPIKNEIAFVIDVMVIDGPASANVSAVRSTGVRYRTVICRFTGVLFDTVKIFGVCRHSSDVSLSTGPPVLCQACRAMNTSSTPTARIKNGETLTIGMNDQPTKESYMA